jgi:ribosomal protein S18 acetylase RimI-like enzyme
MLYHAVFVPAGRPQPPRNIVNRPDIAKYVHNWGRPDDLGVIAVDTATQQPVGAAWLRLFTRENPGYGYVDDDTPELTIALLPRYRDEGIGTSLLMHLLQVAAGRYPAVSLSVARENPALRLYQRLGFEVVGESGASSVTMRQATASASA